MIKFLFDKFGGGAFIVLLLYSISITFISKGLYNDKSELRTQITQTEKQLQTERRLRRIDGEAYKKLQAQKEPIEKRRRESIDALRGLDHETQIIIDRPIPPDLKRLLK